MLHIDSPGRVGISVILWRNQGPEESHLVSQAMNLSIKLCTAQREISEQRSRSN